jgi:hypothetical protein
MLQSISLLMMTSVTHTELYMSSPSHCGRKLDASVHITVDGSATITYFEGLGMPPEFLIACHPVDGYCSDLNGISQYYKVPSSIQL